MSPFIALSAFDPHEQKCVSAHSLLFLSCSHHWFRGNTPIIFQISTPSCIWFTGYPIYCSLNKKGTSNPKKYRYYGYNYPWVTWKLVQWKQFQLESMRMQVWSLAFLSGLVIQHCDEPWCRSKMQLGSSIAVAVV